VRLQVPEFNTTEGRTARNSLISTIQQVSNWDNRDYTKATTAMYCSPPHKMKIWQWRRNSMSLSDHKEYSSRGTSNVMLSTFVTTRIRKQKKDLINNRCHCWYLYDQFLLGINVLQLFNQAWRQFLPGIRQCCLVGCSDNRFVVFL
jgi:hypothetical protein